jgi:glycosyltransferase involved in cell wall biosynthesis
MLAKDHLFVGKDQTIMAALVFQYPNAVKMILADRSIRDHWFTLLHTFSPPPTSTKPFFSILIPLYNGIEFLEETLLSIRNQTFQDYEVLIGVNGHPANSDVFQKAKSFSFPKVTVYDFPSLQGKAATLNALQEKAQADWIALCDADDLWETQKLKIQKECIHHFQDVDVLGTHCEYFGDMIGSPTIPFGDISKEDFWKANPLLHSTVVLRKSLAQWNPENRILEDYELWLRLRYQKKAYILNIPYSLMKHRIHKTSFFNNINAQAVPDLLKRLRSEIES